MAKGNFITTLVRGKLGNMVGYKNTNSKNKEKQAWRGYVPTISNPKTSGQAKQRMIIGNLTRNYGAYKAILSRAYEGVKYGGQSYQRFLKLNIENAKNGPFIPKGSRTTPLPIPGLQVSEGSIIPITVSDIIPYSNVGGEGQTLIPTMSVSDIYFHEGNSSFADPNLTWGQVSERFIVNNSDMQDGDQFTFIEVTVTENLEYVYRYKSVILDTDSSVVMNTPYTRTVYREMDGIYFAISTTALGRNLMFSLVGPEDGEVPVAAAVIQSRRGSDGKWLRSTAFLYVDEGNTEIMQYFTPEMYQLAVDSYMDGGVSTAVDWPTEEEPEVTESFVKTLASYGFSIDNSTQYLQCRFIAGSAGTRKMLVRTVEGVDYPLDANHHVLEFNDTPVPASAATPAIATVNVADLAQYGL